MISLYVSTTLPLSVKQNIFEYKYLYVYMHQAEDTLIDFLLNIN